MDGFSVGRLREALAALSASLSRLVNGEVVLEFSPNRVFVSAIRSAKFLDFGNTGEGADGWPGRFSYRDYFEPTALPRRPRAYRGARFTSRAPRARAN